jgi:ABC-type multidrug transport system fused ATPase/permease subunit
MDSSRILVMKEGRVAEFNRPKALLQRENRWDRRGDISRGCSVKMIS